jgi:hypothetical protein
VRGGEADTGQEVWYPDWMMDFFFKAHYLQPSYYPLVRATASIPDESSQKSER